MDNVFSIYNSFRKEVADATHLSEFQHIEFEGKLDSEANIQVFLGLYKFIIRSLFENNAEDILYFLSPEKFAEKMRISLANPVRMTFKEAL